MHSGLRRGHREWVPSLLGAVQGGDVLPRRCGGAVRTWVRVIFSPLLGEWNCDFFFSEKNAVAYLTLIWIAQIARVEIIPANPIQLNQIKTIFFFFVGISDQISAGRLKSKASKCTNKFERYPNSIVSVAPLQFPCKISHSFPIMSSCLLPPDDALMLVGGSRIVYPIQERLSWVVSVLHRSCTTTHSSILGSR